MKNIHKILSISVGLFLLLFTSCTEEFPEREESPVTPEGCLGVYFPGTNATAIELEPQATSINVTIARTDSSAAATVPITTLKNDSSIFVIPENVSFAAGEGHTTLSVSFPNAVVGTNYSFEVIVEGDEYVDYYTISEAPSIRVMINKVKWNNLGTAQFYDSFTFYHVAEVTLEQRDDNPLVYRVTSPYQEDILLDAEWEGWIGGSTQEKIVFTVVGGNVTWDGFWYTNLLYQGGAGQEIKANLPSRLDEDGDDQSIVVKDGDGNIQYFELYPYFYIDGLGGWGLNPVYIGFPGFDLAGALGIPIFQN